MISGKELRRRASPSNGAKRTFEDLRRRHQTLARRRAMTLCRDHAGFSQEGIGELFRSAAVCRIYQSLGELASTEPCEARSQPLRYIHQIEVSGNIRALRNTGHLMCHSGIWNIAYVDNILEHKVLLTVAD
jgi:hypothetical protein